MMTESYLTAGRAGGLALGSVAGLALVLALCSTACSAGSGSGGGSQKTDNAGGAGGQTDSSSATTTTTGGGLNFGDGGPVITGDDGGPYLGDLSTCAKSAQQVALMPLDLGLLVDTSASMDYDSKWLKISGALAVVSESSRYTNVGMALQYFPLRLACDEAAYATPDVPMGTLPSVGPALRASLAKKQMFGGTPLVQALRGMGKYVTDWATAHPTHRTVLVVATDGMPDGVCAGSVPPNSLANAVTVAQGLAGGTLYPGSPKVLVFVVGVGTDLTALNAVAAAGGSGQAILVSTGADVDTQFIAALDAIRRQTLTCTYPIPSDHRGALDLANVNVSFSQGATAQTFVYVPTLDDCTSANGVGWTFDNAATPANVVLCPDACQTVSTATSGGVSVVFGCKTVTIVK